MRGVSLNYREILVSYGRYGATQQKPLILGSEGAGEIVGRGLKGDPLQTR